MAKQKKQTSEAAVREIRRGTRRKFSSEEKIRIVLEGLRGEQSVAELCQREGEARAIGERRVGAAAGRDRTRVRIWSRAPNKRAH